MTSGPHEIIQAQAAAHLEQFITAPDQFTKDDVPLGLEPHIVAELVKLRVNRASGLATLQQTRKVVDFYDVQEVAPQFVEMFDEAIRSEDDRARAIERARIAAIVGKPPEVDAARRQFAALTSGAQTVSLFERLALLLNELPPGTDPASLKAALDARISAIGAKASADPTLARERQSLERLSSFTLPRVARAAEVKKTILGTSDRERRLDEEARTYLGLKYGFGEYLPAWAARRLRRETWTPAPDPAATRDPKPDLRASVAAALNTVLGSIDGMAEITDDEKTFFKVSALEAILFFGGTISPAQQTFLNEHRKEQKAYLRPPG